MLNFDEIENATNVNLNAFTIPSGKQSLKLIDTRAIENGDGTSRIYFDFVNENSEPVSIGMYDTRVRAFLKGIASVLGFGSQLSLNDIAEELTKESHKFYIKVVDGISKTTGNPYSVAEIDFINTAQLQK